MLTRQMWLVAHLSGERTVERVEAVVGNGAEVFVADHPKRCLRLGVDIHETFVAARDASVRYLETKIQNLQGLVDATRTQQEPG